jgi:hypothetical protein
MWKRVVYEDQRGQGIAAMNGIANARAAGTVTTNAAQASRSPMSCRRDPLAPWISWDVVLTAISSAPGFP